MKKFCLISCSMLAAVWASKAVVVSSYSYTGPAYSILDGNPSGAFSSISVSGTDHTLVNLVVSLNLTGGYNGDLYGYLSYGGTLLPLLNRIGVSSGNPFGSGGAGMNVTFSDAAPSNIHTAGNGFLTGAYRPDGQNISPLSPPASFNPAGGSMTLTGTFANLNPNGTWTLFIADVTAGGGTSQVNSWGLQITAVPEPGTCALFTLAFGALLWRRRPRTAAL